MTNSEQSSGSKESASPTTQPEESAAPVTATEPAPPLPVSRSFTEQADASNANTPEQDADAVTWTASEFIGHNKSPLWYLGLGGAILLLAAVVLWLTKDIISTVVIVLVGIVMGIYGARQPRQLKYALSPNGLLIENRFFPLHAFRSYAVVDEGPLSSIVFMPLKRFGQLVTIYIDPSDEDKILDILSAQLPLDNHKSDAIDQFMKRIRF